MASVRAYVTDEPYGVDLTPFQDDLRRRGFAVPVRSRSNYGQTHLCLASSLNMSYVDDLPRIMGMPTIAHLLTSSSLRAASSGDFVELGYELVMIGSDYA